MMNRRRLLAFIVYIKQEGEKSFEEIERMFYKFSVCEVPYLNLNHDGIRILAKANELHNLYSVQEIEEIHSIIHSS